MMTHKFDPQIEVDQDKSNLTDNGVNKGLNLWVLWVIVWARKLDWMTHAERRRQSQSQGCVGHLGYHLCIYDVLFFNENGSQ